MDLQGIGWLGMDSHTVTDATDVTSPLTTKTVYDHISKAGSIYPYAGKVTSTEVKATLANGTTISRVTTQTFTTPQVLNGGSRTIILPDTREFTETETTQTSGTSQVNRTWKHVTTCNPQYGYVMTESVTIGGDTGEKEDTTYQFLSEDQNTYEKVAIRVEDRGNDNSTRLRVGQTSKRSLFLRKADLKLRCTILTATQVHCWA